MLSALQNYLHDVFVAQFDWWIVLGFAAQALFSARFFVQWIASEHAGRSVVPTAFWWFSIGGGILLGIYPLSHRDPVFTAGHGLGVFTHRRNIFLVADDGAQGAPLGRTAGVSPPRHSRRALRR